MGTLNFDYYPKIVSTDYIAIQVDRIIDVATVKCKTEFSFVAGDIPTNKDKEKAEKTEKSDMTIEKSALEVTTSVATNEEIHERGPLTDVENTDKKKIKAGRLTRAIFTSWANLFLSLRPIEDISYKAIAHVCLLQPSR